MVKKKDGERENPERGFPERRISRERWRVKYCTVQKTHEIARIV